MIRSGKVRFLKWPILLAAGLLLTGIAFVATGMQATTPSGQPVLPEGNLISNADFQAGSGPIPAQWVLNSDLQRKGSVRLVAGLSGGKAVELSPNRNNTDTGKPFALAQIIPVSPLRGQRLRVQTAMKVTSQSQAFLLVFQLDRSGKPLGHLIFEQLDAQPDFRVQKNSLTVDADAENILVACSVNGTSGAAQFAEMSLRREESAASSAPFGTTAASATGDRQHVIEVDASAVLKPVEQGLFGSNVEWFRDGNGIWDPDRDDFRESILQPAGELGVSVLRYPGGGLADNFHWRESVGPVPGAPTRRTSSIRRAEVAARFP